MESLVAGRRACPTTWSWLGIGMFRRYWWVFLAMAVMGPLVGFAVAAAVSYVMPRKYESVAIVQTSGGSVPMVAEGGAEPMNSMPSRFLATEMEVIKAEKTLEMAVDRLDLPTRWMIDKRSAVEIVRKSVRLNQVRGTELIEIRVRHTNAEDACDIARQVAIAYRDRRAEIEQQRAGDALAEANKMLAEQKERVDVRQKALYELLDRLGVDDDDGEDGGAGPDSSGDPGLRQLYLAAQEEHEAEQLQYEKMRVEMRSERIQLSLPRNPVMIHQEPSPGRVPVSPNVTLNLVLGTVAGVPAGLLLAFPLALLLGRIADRKK